jgi:hypothetical protein
MSVHALKTLSLVFCWSVISPLTLVPMNSVNE